MDIIYQATEEAVWNRHNWSAKKEKIYDHLVTEGIDTLLEFMRTGRCPRPDMHLLFPEETCESTFCKTVEWLLVARVRRNSHAWFLTATYFGPSDGYVHRPEPDPHGQRHDKREFSTEWRGTILVAKPKRRHGEGTQSIDNQLHMAWPNAPGDNVFNFPAPQNPATNSASDEDAAIANAAGDGHVVPRGAMSVIGLINTKGGAGKTKILLHLMLSSSQSITATDILQLGVEGEIVSSLPGENAFEIEQGAKDEVRCATSTLERIETLETIEQISKLAADLKGIAKQICEMERRIKRIRARRNRAGIFISYARNANSGECATDNGHDHDYDWLEKPTCVSRSGEIILSGSRTTPAGFLDACRNKQPQGTAPEMLPR